MITLYEGIEIVKTQDHPNGAAFTSDPYQLPDAIDCAVTEERNGQFSLVMRYPVGAKNWDKIIPDAIIMATPRPNASEEPFRIYEIEQVIDGVVTARANHLVYDLDGLSFAKPYERFANIQGISAVLTELSNAGQFVTRCFHLENDGITDTTTTVDFGDQKSITIWGAIGAVCAAFGAEMLYTWDSATNNCAITFCAARGSAKNTKIAYGVNLIAFDRKLDYSGLYSRVVAAWYPPDGTIPYAVQGWADTGYTGRDRSLWIDVTEEFPTQPTQPTLNAWAQEYVDSHDWSPSSDLTVDFVPLENTTEYVQPPVVSPLTDTAPYSFRTSGGSLSLGIRNRETDSLAGGTVAWNQLVHTSDTSVTVTNGHKYLSRINSTNAIAISNGSAISINDGTEDNVFDLTAMFGSTIADYVYTLESGTAGAGIAWLKKYGYFTKPYYPYKAAALESVKTSAHKTIGFNQWDEVWEAGLISASNGQNTTGTGIRSKNYCRCVPNTTYHARSGNASSMYVFWYDADKNFISYASQTNANFNATSPTNACYFKVRKDGSNTYANDICINLHWDGERDGEYEAYEAHTYALDDVELRGILKLDASNNLYADGDIYPPIGEVQRRYSVKTFVGAATGEYWQLQSVNSNGIANFYITVPAYANAANSICDKFIRQTSMIADTTDEGFMLSGSTTLYIRIKSTTASTVAAFKTWLSSNNVTLVYELATPTTESASPYINPQIVDASGTEQYVDAGTRDFDMPVGHSTEYTFVPEDNRLYLCDTATVDASLIGVSATAKCVRVVYNVLTDMYDTVTVGTVQQDIVDTILKLGE